MKAQTSRKIPQKVETRLELVLSLYSSEYFLSSSVIFLTIFFIKLC